MPLSELCRFKQSGITQEYLHECFDYIDGKLYWKERPRYHFSHEWAWKRFNNTKAGKEAGCIVRGYVNIKFNGLCFLAHRIIWFMMTGESPEIIDHINKDTTDNRLDNLRNGNYFTNAMNTERAVGAYWHKQRGRWCSTIVHNKERIYVGSFDTKEQAVKAYRAKVLELKGVDLNIDDFKFIGANL